MEKSEVKKYLGAIGYSIFLVITIALCLTNNIYISMLPIAFVVGIIGQILFGKKIMTTVFCAIFSIILLQVKYPQSIIYNLYVTMQIIFGTLMGELYGWGIRNVVRLYKSERGIAKKLKNKGIIACIISLVLAIGVNIRCNGDYLTYFLAKNSLKEYMNATYNSINRFKIDKSEYSIVGDRKYIFKAYDVMNSNKKCTFYVYLDNLNNVSDDIEKDTKEEIPNDIKEIISRYNTEDIIVTIDKNENEIYLEIDKNIEKINEEEKAKYINEIINVIADIKKYEEFEISYLKMFLNAKEEKNVAALVKWDDILSVVDNYDEMINYINQALNVEVYK